MIQLLLVTLLGLALPGRAQQAAPAIPGDRVTLKSGSVLVGEITLVDDEHVKIDVDELDELELDWEDIANVQSAGDYFLGTGDGARFDAVLAGREGDRLRVTVAGESRLIPIASLEEAVGGRAGVEWKGSVSLGVGVSSGNTERRSGQSAADVTRRTDDDRLRLRFQWRTEETKDKATRRWIRTERYINGGASYDYFVSDRLFAFVRGLAESDRNSNLDRRLSGDFGLGYQFVDLSHVEYSAQVGVGYTDERYSTAGDDNAYAGATVSHSFYWEIVEDLEFLHDTKATQSLEESKDLLVRLDSKLRWSMIEDLFGELQYLVDYNRNPAAGTERTDQRLLLNFGWSF